MLSILDEINVNALHATNAFTFVAGVAYQLKNDRIATCLETGNYMYAKFLTGDGETITVTEDEIVEPVWSDL